PAESGISRAISAGIRRQGSAALDLAYVAAGRYDAFWERALNPWDIAAGMILVREAGGLVSKIGAGTAASDPLPTGDIVSGSPEGHAALVKALS
ncbi:MAG: inositol monophosphatase family protein, partial [Pseudomonadota bacterium]